jgi:hypothetical protein
MSGAGIFYHIALAARQQELLVAPARPLSMGSPKQAEALLATALKVAAGLQRYYAAGIQLRIHPLSEGARLLREYEALRLLKAQMKQEAARTWQTPPDEMYLYDEPMHTWVGRLVQAHPWIRWGLQAPRQ